MEFSAIALVVAFIVMALSNYLANAKFFGGKDNKELSDSHPTYLSPDGFTFAIWGLIYMLELVMVIAQLFDWSPRVDEIFGLRVWGLDLRTRLIIAFLANSVWLPIFNNELFFCALGIMGVYLAFLLTATLDLSVAALGDPVSYLVFGSGLAMNTSWIVVAFSLSIFFCGGEVGWKDQHGVAGSVPAAIGVLFIVAAIGCARAFLQGELAWAFVTAWALRGIYRMQTVEDAVRFPPTALNATLASVAKYLCFVVVLAMAAGVVKALAFGKSGSNTALSAFSVPLLRARVD